MNLASIVILNWNGKSYLEKFLPTLLEQSVHPGVEIVIADNASTDDSLDFLKADYPGLRVIELDQNYGFSGGYNRAFRVLESKYFLLLNSDIEVTPNWLPPLLERMESDDQIAACTPKILDYNRRDHFEYAGAAGGYLDRYGYPFCRGRIFDTLEEDNQQFDDVEIFWGSGACILVRSELFNRAGGLDEKFFAHMEEIDLCWRLKKMGFRIEYVSGSHVFHVGGGTLPKDNPMKTFLNYRNNLLLLYKNLPEHGKSRLIFIRMLLDGISALRFLLLGAFADFRAVFRAHFAYYGLRSHYREWIDQNKSALPDQNKSVRSDVMFPQIYPHSIVLDYFLKGRKRFEQIQHRF